ncbi:MAG: glycosyltransferase [Candidatus Thermoplasmatota archaeon]|nr:glycosyltransferase [Candidatus Thermoplasmatota archaeon]
MLLATALVEVILASLVVVPLIRYRLRANQWNKLTLDYPSTSHDTELTILLPIWNEAVVIEKKLADLHREYPAKTSLLVIDSASTDESVSLVNQWITNNSEAFSTTEVIVMPERLGKTSAVKLAVEHLTSQSYSGLVLMTDADALIASETVDRLYGWFADNSIGAVGSSANRRTNLHGEQDYRAVSELLRSAESKIDSTPFLEGSCMMWRHGSFDASDLNTDCNADDAQIASLIRINGLRSIFDSKASFTDFAPSTVEGQRRQKIRRAQGLQNMLRRFSQQHKLPDEGRFAKIFRTQHYLHNTAPILLFQIAISAIIRWLYVSIYGMPVGFEAITHASLAFIELMVLVSWLTYRNGIKLPGVNLIGSIVTSFEYLFIAYFRNSRGILSNKWDQHQDTRQLLNDY